MKDKKYIKKRGFTLSEVLITLGIIGVVAALVLPTIIKNYQEASYKAAWKKGYSNFSQAFSQIVAENGGSIAGVCSTVDSAGQGCFLNLFTAKLNTVKICNVGQLEGNCWHKSNTWKYLNNVTSATSAAVPGFILSDGSLVYVYLTNKDCQEQVVAGATKRCGYMGIDINGFNPPNIVGKDIFGSNILSGRTLPKGTTNDAESLLGYTCINGSTNASNTGQSCSTKYLYE